MRVQLKALVGPDRGRVYALPVGQTLLVGRSQDAHVCLTDPRVSRTHCQLVVQPPQVWLTDRNSTGGTFVNGERITHKPLFHGDVLVLGETQLRLVRLDVADQTTLAPTEGHELTSGLPGNAPTDRLASLVSQLTGRTLGHYQIGAVLGQGQTGVVFRAQHLSPAAHEGHLPGNTSNEPTEAAVKVLWPEITQEASAVERFIRAMRTVIPLRHPHLVALHTAGQTDHYCWMAMELVEGESVARVVARQKEARTLDWLHALEVTLHVSRALVFAHYHRIVHRNIAPQNVLIRSSDRQVKLSDLMAAKAMEGPLAQQITQAGQLLGDLHYLAPEQIANHTQVDERADLYSLGATAYAILTGNPPHQGSSPVEVLQKKLQTDPPSPRSLDASMPQEFEEALMRLLVRNPEDRFQSAREVLITLEKIARSLPTATLVPTQGENPPRALPVNHVLAEAVPAPTGGTPHAPASASPGRRVSTCAVCSGPLEAISPLTPDGDPLWDVVCSGCRELIARQYQDIPGYHLVRELGKGGMGTVYLALRSKDERLVAVKAVRPPVQGTQIQVQHFLREANTLKQLNHPNIVAFHEMNSANGLLYFAMDYIKGCDANVLVEREGPLSVARACDLTCQLLEALAFAHDQGFIHRDVKPHNVMVTRESTEPNTRELVKLADFGLARVYQTSELSGLTHQGMFRGTTGYMAPEQITDYRNATPLVDQYAAGSTIYYLLTGHLPHDFDTSEPFKPIFQVLKEDAIPIRQLRDTIPPELESIIARTLQRDPKHRFTGVRAFQTALAPFTRR